MKSLAIAGRPEASRQAAQDLVAAVEEVGLDDHRQGRRAVPGVEPGLGQRVHPAVQRAEPGRAHLDLGDDRWGHPGAAASAARNALSAGVRGAPSASSDGSIPAGLGDVLPPAPGDRAAGCPARSSREAPQLFELRPGGAGRDRLAGALDAFFQGGDGAADVERGAGVQRRDVARAAPSRRRRRGGWRRRSPPAGRPRGPPGGRGAGRSAPARGRTSAPRRPAPRRRGCGRWW